MKVVMAKNKDLMEKIDEVRANNVTPEKFEEKWGYTLEDHAERMMQFIHELEGENPSQR